MTDALDRLWPPASTLLGRVDTALAAHGVPPGHPIVALLRRLGTLPSDAVGAIAARRSAPLRDTGSVLRSQAHRYRDQHALLAPVPDWKGAAGERYEAERAALTGLLADAAGRLDATADYLDEVADWVDESRRALAVAVFDVLDTAEAVAVCGGGPPAGSPPPAVAAADIGARVLDAVDAAETAGHDLCTRWSGRLDELPYRPSSQPPHAAADFSVDLDRPAAT